MTITTDKTLTDLQTTVSKAIESLDWPVQPKELYNPARHAFSIPGKQIRPLLSLLGAGLAREKPNQALPVGKAVEVLHTFTLVHDDIMDQADQRRGQASVHAQWDTATAILSGDVIFARALQLLLPYGTDQFAHVDKKGFYRIQQRFLDGITEICEGQAMDMAFAHQESVELDDYLSMINKKTAALLAISLELGGRAVDADNHELHALETIGRKAGLAFQIQDDLLDIQADSNTSGKIRGGDLREGKKTYLTILGLQRSTGKDKDFLSAALGNRDLSEKDVQKAYHILNDLNIISDAEQAIQEYYQQAFSALNIFPDSHYKKALKDLLNHLITRSF
jgi:geranylgeranyl diphosphate synthase type II